MRRSKTSDEAWLPIPGFPGYAVSSYRRVYSFKTDRYLTSFGNTLYWISIRKNNRNYHLKYLGTPDATLRAERTGKRAAKRLYEMTDPTHIPDELPDEYYQAGPPLGWDLED